MISAFFPFPGQKDPKEHRFVKSFDNHYRSRIISSRAVLLKTNIQSSCTPPDFSFFEKRPPNRIIELFLLPIPPIKIFFHIHTLRHASSTPHKPKPPSVARAVCGRYCGATTQRFRTCFLRLTCLFQQERRLLLQLRFRRE